jgi:hypothetical protein
LVAWDQDALNAQDLPRHCKVWEGDAPIFNFLIDVCFVTEGVATIGGSTEEAFVLLPIPLIRDFGARLEKWHGGA